MQGFTWGSNQQPPSRHRCIRNDQTNNPQMHFNDQRIQNRYTNGQQVGFNQWNGPEDRFFDRCNRQANWAPSHHPFTDFQTQQHYNSLDVAPHNMQRIVPQPGYPADNHNTYSCNARYNNQSYFSGTQANRNIGPWRTNFNQASMNSRPVDKNHARGWRSHISKNGSPYPMNNQQQHQQPNSDPPPYHSHRLVSGQGFRKLLTKWNSKPGRLPQSTSIANNSGPNQRIPNNQARGRPEDNHASDNSVMQPPVGAGGNSSLPSTNLQESPVHQSQAELRVKAGSNLSTTQSQNNQSIIMHQSQGTDSVAYNMNQTTKNQRIPINKAQILHNSKSNSNWRSLHKQTPMLYQLLQSEEKQLEQYNVSGSETNKQPSESVAQNGLPKQAEAHAANRADHSSHSKELYSAPCAQFRAEPPSKRINYGVIQRDSWNQVPLQETSMSENKSGIGLQSIPPGTHQTDRTDQTSGRKRLNGTSQLDIEYSTDPADCLEVVLALQRAAQNHKAVAIVPPISQQTSNTEESSSSPPLKINTTRPLVAQNHITNEHEKLPHTFLPVIQQNDKRFSLENDNTTNNIADPSITQSLDACSASSTERPQNNMQWSEYELSQNDMQVIGCTSGDSAFDLSSAPVVQYTLEQLTSLVKSLEMAELSAGYTMKHESVYELIKELYWNGNAKNAVEAIKLLKAERVIECSFFESVQDYKSVVFESVEPETLKKLANCDILNNESYSLSEELGSSWLSVVGQPADIDKVLSEPLSDYELTLSNGTSQLFCENISVPSSNLGVFSLNEVPKVTSINADGQNVRTNMCSSSVQYPTDICTPSAENDIDKAATVNKGHSLVRSSETSFLCTVSSVHETSEKQGDIKQIHNHPHNLNTKLADLSQVAEISSKEPTESIKESVFHQDPIRDIQKHNLDLEFDPIIDQQVNLWSEPDSGSLPLSAKDEALASDDVKNIFPKEAVSNSTETWKVKDISDDDNSGKKIAPNSTDTWMVEDISDDDNSGNGMGQIEDISDDESDNKKARNSMDTCEMKDVSNDENSSDDSFLMEVTVLSSEDAKTIFEQLEEEPQHYELIQKNDSTKSNFDCPKLAAWCGSLSKICCRCGTNQIITSTYETKTYCDRELFCTECWDTAPSLEINLEAEPCSPKKNETDVLQTSPKSDECRQNCRTPILELEVQEPAVVLTKTNIADEGLTKQNIYSKTESVKDQMPEIQSSVEQVPTNLQTNKMKNETPETVVSTESHIAYEGLNKQKTDRGTESVKDQMPEIQSSAEQVLTNVQTKKIKDEKPKTVDSGEMHINDGGQIKQKTDIEKESVKDRILKIQSSAEQVLTKVQTNKIKDEKKERLSLSNPQTLKQCNKPPPTKSTVVKQKLKSQSNTTGFDDCVLFAPDVVLKKTCPQKKNHYDGRKPPVVNAIKRPSNDNQKCRNEKKMKVKEPRQERREHHLNPVTERTLLKRSEDQQKVKEKVSSHSNATPFITTKPHKSKRKSESDADIQPAKRMKKAKSVSFALYGFKTDHHDGGFVQKIGFQERRFSVPATLTVSDTRKDYNDILSAKQKVLSQWSSTFIPKIKKSSPPKSPQQKKKPQKPQEILKSNMVALKSHLQHRATLLSTKR